MVCRELYYLHYIIGYRGITILQQIDTNPGLKIDFLEFWNKSKIDKK